MAPANEVACLSAVIVSLNETEGGQGRNRE